MRIDGVYFNPEQTKWLKEFIKIISNDIAILKTSEVTRTNVLNIIKHRAGNKLIEG